MSRSFKKKPICKQRNSKDEKAIANRKLRQEKALQLFGEDGSLPKGKAYKKANESWDICDWTSHFNSYTESLKQAESEEDLHQIKKNYINK